MKRLILAAAAALAATFATAQGVTDTQVLLGQSVALTGPAQQLGLDMQLGATLYFNQVNARGGVNGRKIVLKTLDDGYEPPNAVANTKKFINDEKVFALFGYVGTPTSNAVLPIFTEARVPFVGPFTGAESLRTPHNRYIFHVRASYFDETEAIVQHLTAMSVNKIAVFYQNDGYGQAGLAGVERALKKRNMEIAARATVERNTVDVKKAVETMVGTQPQAIVMISAYKSCAAFIKEMKKAGSNPTFWNVSFVGSKALAKELDREGAACRSRRCAVSLGLDRPGCEGIPPRNGRGQARDRFRHARGLDRRQGDGRGPQARRPQARPRVLHPCDGTMSDLAWGDSRWRTGQQPQRSKFVDLTIFQDQRLRALGRGRETATVSAAAATGAGERGR